MGYASYLEDIRENLISRLETHFESRGQAVDESDFGYVRNAVTRVVEQALGRYVPIFEILDDPTNLDLANKVQSLKKENRELREEINHLKSKNWDLAIENRNFRVQLRNANKIIGKQEEFRKNWHKYPPQE